MEKDLSKRRGPIKRETAGKAEKPGGAGRGEAGRGGWRAGPAAVGAQAAPPARGRSSRREVSCDDADKRGAERGGRKEKTGLRWERTGVYGLLFSLLE